MERFGAGEKSAGCLNPRAASLRTLLLFRNAREATAVPEKSRIGSDR
jgi:hypothetical protein